jgi:sorbose reductase
LFQAWTRLRHICRYKVEVTDADKIEQTVKQVVNDFGKLDCFVANAGTAISKPITEQTLDEYRTQMSVNGELFKAIAISIAKLADSRRGILLRASRGPALQKARVWQPHHHLQHLSPYCQRAGRSARQSIIHFPPPPFANITQVYNMTKAAVTHLGKSLAREWRDFARVNIVSPGFFNTKMGAAPRVVNEAYRMTPQGRQGHTREIKGLYLYLASDASSYQTGSDTIIDGGYILP